MADDDGDQTTGLDEKIEALQDHDPEEVADALDNGYHPVWQTIFDGGRDNGKKEIGRKHKNAQDRIETLETKVEQKENELETLREEQPDLDEAYDQWEENELQPVKEKLSGLQERVRSQAKKEARQRVQSHVEQEVGDDFLADTVTAKHRDRIKVNEDGEAQFMRPDGNNPYATRSDQDPAKLMAQDIVEQIPEPYRNQNEQGGPRSTDGTNGEASSAEASGLTRAEIFTDTTKAAEFRSKFDSQEEFEEAVQQLPEN